MARKMRVSFRMTDLLVIIRGCTGPTKQAMWRRLAVVGVSTLLLLLALLLLNRKAAQVTYYKWQLRSAGEALATKDGLGHFVGMLAGAGDAQARYARARQALLDLDYLRELELPFPAGSDWPGLLRQVRTRFPDGLWELSLDPSSSTLRITAPTCQLEAWRTWVSEFAARQRTPAGI
jgi:uncharacterized integral membrane protein